MRKHRFERLVARALNGLPRQFRERLENVVVLVESEPTAETLKDLDLGPEEVVYGLYFGVPLGERGSSYGLTLPDRIVVYQRPIEQACSSDAAIARFIRRVVAHEVAHHFGMSENELRGMSRA